MRMFCVGRRHHLSVGIVTAAALARAAMGGDCELYLDRFSAGDTSARFGNAVAISGSMAVAGAPLQGGLNNGAAWTLELVDASTWVFGNQLNSPAPAEEAKFGSAVAIDGDVIVVGQPSGIGGAGGSIAFIYAFNGGSWGLLANLSFQGNTLFGQSVAIRGDVIVVGAPGTDNSIGAAHVFVKQGPVWTTMGSPTATLLPDASAMTDRGGDVRFGAAVSIDGDTVVVGAPGLDAPVMDSGAVFVFEPMPGGWSGSSVHIAKLTIDDASGADQLGDDTSLSILGDVIACGAQGADNGIGAIYLWERPPGGWVDSFQTARLNGSIDGDAFDHLGRSTSIGDGMIIAGAHTDNIPGLFPNGQGSVRIFARPLTGWTDADVEDAFLVAPDAPAMSSTPHFGFSVAVDGANLIVGAPDAQNPSSGSIYAWNVADCGTNPIPGTSLWVNEGDGDFEVDSNWIPDSPNAADRARFVDLGLGPGVPLSVSLTQDEVNDGLEVFGGDLLLDLGGGIYELTLATSGPFEEAVLVEDLGGPTAQLTIVNGLLDSRTGMIGGSLDSNGGVTVLGADAAWRVNEAGGSFSGSLVVGLGGTARLDILGGALVEAVSVDIGFLGAADGTVHVAGAGSKLSAGTFIRVGSGVLEVFDGGVVELDSILGVIVTDPPSTVRGDGTLVGNLILEGLLDPSATADSVGALTIDGSADFRGTVAIDIRDTNDFDTVSVADTAYLGGALLVNVEFEPALGQSFPVLDAAFVETHFDIAFMPGLADGRFMTLEYGPGIGLGGESATIVVEDLDSLFNFGDPESIDVSRAPSAVVVGDFDNQDGDDVAIAIPDADPLANGTVLVLLNAGTDLTGWLGFASSTPIDVGREPSGLTVGDFNGDGNLDIAVTNSGDDTVSILTNSAKSPGTFVAAVPFGVGDQPSALAAADFGEDANGDTDLVVANAGDNNLYILVNINGTGVFSLATVIPTQGSPFAVDPSDLDNDKDVDVVAVNLGSDSITIAFNTGGGGFAAPMHLAVGDAPVDLVIADLDLDPDPKNNGVLDIATVNRGDDTGGAGTVSILLNNGDGTFLPAITLPVGDMAQSLTAIDLEGDGDLDIALVANDDGGQRVVQVLRNDMPPGSGQLIFAEAAELAAGTNPLFVTTGDLDGDTEDDLITVNEVLAAAANQTGPINSGSVNVAINAGALPNLPCVWDCGTVDGNVGINDFLALLGQWGQAGMSCSFNGTAIGIVEFLDLLANWGPCP